MGVDTGLLVPRPPPGLFQTGVTPTDPAELVRRPGSPTTPHTELAPVGVGPSVGAIPGTNQIYELWNIGGIQYLVYWIVTGDGPNDRFPLAYQFKPGEVRTTFAGSPEATPTIFNTVGSGLDADGAWAAFESMGGFLGGFVSELANMEDDPIPQIAEQMRILHPEITDPAFWAVEAAAFLEGRTPTEQEFLANSPWYQSMDSSQRNWLNLLNSDPQEAQRLLEDNRVSAEQLLSNAGVFRPPEGLVNLLADQYTHGTWSEVYLMRQIELIADPLAQGDRDPTVLEWLTTGGPLDTTVANRETVRNLVTKWLGPQLGDWSNRQIDRWASRFREEEDAQDELVSVLQRQRAIMLPGYDDPTLTYEDIANPFRQIWQNEWNQPADEMDPLFLEVVNTQDYSAASELLRREGIAQGVGFVQNSLLGDLYRAMGGVTVRPQ